MLKGLPQTIVRFFFAVACFILVLVCVYHKKEDEHTATLYNYFKDVRAKKYQLLISYTFEEHALILNSFVKDNIFLGSLLNNVTRSTHNVSVLYEFRIPKKYMLLNVVQGCILRKICMENINLKELEGKLIDGYGLCINDMMTKDIGKRKFNNIFNQEMINFETDLKYTWNVDALRQRKCKNFNLSEVRLEHLLYMTALPIN